MPCGRWACSSGTAHEDEVCNRVAKAQAAGLKLGEGPPVGPGGESAESVFKQWLLCQHRKHLLGIVWPVGRTVEITTGPNPVCDEMGHRWLNESALVMPRLGPGIWKKEVDAVQGGLSQPAAQHINGIVLDDSDVREAIALNSMQERTHTSGIDLQAEKIPLRIPGRNGGGGLSHAKPNLQDHRIRIAKKPWKVDRMALVRQ